MKFFRWYMTETSYDSIHSRGHKALVLHKQLGSSLWFIYNFLIIFSCHRLFVSSNHQFRAARCLWLGLAGTRLAHDLASVQYWPNFWLTDIVLFVTNC